ADLEFVQFHPTTLADRSLLLSEALRGAGALLVDEQGQRFTDELAPRDVVARAVDARGVALLDLRPVDRSRFPGLMSRLAEAGFRPEEEPIPVAPAAHYTMGGAVTDLDGRTELPGLYPAARPSSRHGADCRRRPRVARRGLRRRRPDERGGRARRGHGRGGAPAQGARRPLRSRARARRLRRARPERPLRRDGRGRRRD